MTVALSPLFNGFQSFLSSGLPNNGGFIYAYAAGTTTPQATYTSSSGSTPNANPIVLGTDGRPPNEIWLTAATGYKFVVTDATGTPLPSSTFDNITATVGTAASGANNDITSLSALTTVNGTPNFTGAATGQTATTGDNSTKFATTAFVQNSLPASTPQVRQTVIQGVTNSSGYANMLSPGTGLALSLAATAMPMMTAFAQGASNYIATLSADTANVVTLPANNLSFVTQDYVSPTSVTWGSTLAPPQYGYSFNQAAQSCLSLNNISTDDFGSSWTNTSVTFSNAYAKYAGTYYGVFNGSTSNIRSTAFSSLGNGGWTIRFAFNAAAVSGPYTIFHASNGAYGLQINIASSKLNVYASSTGTSWDIASNLSGSTTLAAGTNYDGEVTYDPVAGKIYVYLNGNPEAGSFPISTASKICGISSITWGCSTAGAQFFSGNLQGCEFKPYCAHPAGTAFTPQATLANVATQGYASDFFSIPNKTMYQITGASTVAGVNPTMTAKLRCYTAEATTGASTVTSVTNYALNGQYDSGIFAVAGSTYYTKSHYIGTTQYNLDLTFADDALGTNERPATPASGTSYGYFGGTSSRTQSQIGFASQVGLVANGGGGAGASGFFRIRARRSF